MSKNSNTRSSLLWEVERLLNELQNLPQLLVMENVTQIHNKKNMPDFQKWIDFLESKGYSNYYQDLNAKDFGVAQNRNRCFMVSILGDYSYTFPNAFPLEKRLKNYLETNVDEKYFLNDTQINRIKSTSYITAQRRIQEKDYCDTLCARDWKDPKCVQVVRKYGIFDTPTSKHQAGSIYDTNALAPTIDTMLGGYRQPCIEIKNNTKQGYLKAYDGDGIYITNIDKKRGTVQKEMIPTLKTSPDIGVVVDEHRRNDGKRFKN